MSAAAQLPWRGPGPGRPDLPLPPGRMPLRLHGQVRKRWRYVGVYGEEVMLCAARVEVGPMAQTFWALWDRDGRRQHSHTRLRPGGGDVVIDGPSLMLSGAGVAAELRLGDGAAVESICPSGRAWGWTRKRAGLGVEGTVRADGREWRLTGERIAVDDQSAGYHRRRTSWLWSAGIGRSRAGIPIAWNLVAGINDPASSSERAIWEGGQPREPQPVSFDGLAGVRFADGAELRFAAEAERSRDDNLILFRSRYRHRFGTFTGSLEGVELESAAGVMEQHDAVW